MNTNFFTWFGTKEIEVMDGNSHSKPLKIKSKEINKRYPRVLKAAAITALLVAGSANSNVNGQSIKAAYEEYQAENIQEFNNIMSKRKDLRTFVDTTKYFKLLEDDDELSHLKDSILYKIDKLENRLEKDKKGNPIYQSYNNMVLFSAYKNLYNMQQLTTNTEDCPAFDILYNLRHLETKEKPSGIHDWSSPFSGKYKKEFDNFVEKAKSDEEFNNQIKAFAAGLYTSNRARFQFFTGFNEDEAQKVQDISKRKYYEWAKYEMKADTIKMVYYGGEESQAGTGYQFSAAIIGEDAIQSYPGVEIHELLHICQFEINTETFEKNSEKIYHSDKHDLSEDKINVYAELGPSLEQLVVCDEIYKEVKGIPIDSVVKYPIPITFQNGAEQNLGELVNTMRDIKKKKKLKTYESVLLTKDGKNFMQKSLSNVNEELVEMQRIAAIKDEYKVLKNEAISR